MYKKLVLATRNPDKITEISELLKDIDVEVVTLRDYQRLPELREGDISLKINAINKARIVAQYTKCIALSDDSGLEVDSLNGAPGVRSSRYAGENVTYQDNNRKLLDQMKDIPWEKRTARFRCIIAIATPTGKVVTCEGVCEGYISLEPRGNAGFGYDPLFYVPELQRTFAELSSSVKNKISHRAKAIEKAKKLLKEILQEL